MNAIKPQPNRGIFRRRKGRAQWFRVYHDPDNLSGGRRLEGVEFEMRKAELEERDRRERAARR